MCSAVMNFDSSEALDGRPGVPRPKRWRHFSRRGHSRQSGAGNATWSRP
ncbi:hypothetical protein GJR88_01739 [Dietzia sp. DQ12-45-1b]|nr:hypothetical protein GJR88_01739 [Dietzia sp. DQ12-45-1b]